ARARVPTTRTSSGPSSGRRGARWCRRGRGAAQRVWKRRPEQSSPSLLTTRQREDLVRAHFYGAAPCHVLDERSTVARLALRAAELHRVADDRPLDLGVRKQPEFLADFDGDGDLALGRDSHGSTHGRKYDVRSLTSQARRVRGLDEPRRTWPSAST